MDHEPGLCISMTLVTRNTTDIVGGVCICDIEMEFEWVLIPAVALELTF